MKSLILTLLLFSTTAFSMFSPKQNIVEIASQNSQLSTLVTAVQVAGLVDTLKSPGPFTVFAPTNMAFENLPDGVLDELLANPDALKEVLLYHVASGRKSSATLSRLTILNTILGQSVSISERKDGLYINDSKVVISDIYASNGVVHVIDAVLIPGK